MTNTKTFFLHGMQQSQRPTHPLLAIVISTLGMGLAGIVPLAFGIGVENSTTLVGQFVMTCSFIAWIAVIFAWVHFKERRSIRSLGFDQGLRSNSFLGLLLGVGLTTSIVLVNVALGNATVGPARWGMLLPSLLLIIGFGIQASAEEIGYRGYLMQAMGARWSVTVTVIVQAVLFTAGHIGNGLNPIAVVTMLAVSYCLAMWILATGNLWGAMSFHTFWNWSQANFWGASVSNITMKTSVFSFTPTSGSDLLTGGSFGLEGSLLTIVILIGIGAFFHLRWRRQSTQN